MADIENLKQQAEQLENIRKAYDALKSKSKELADVLKEQANSQQTIDDLLKEQLGKQAELATSADVQQQLLDDIIERDKKRLKAAKELEFLEAKKAAGVVKLNAEEKRRLKRLQDLQKNHKDILAITEKEVKELEKQKKLIDERVEKQQNIDALLENQVKKTTGLVTSSQNLAQELARTAIEGGDYAGAIDTAVERMKENLSTANLVNSAMAKMGELGDQFNSTMLDANGLLMEFAQADIQFVRDTGLVKKLGTEVKNLRFEFNDLNFLAEETDQAFRGLTQSFTDFTEVDAGVRRDLTEGAAVLERFGVSSDVTGGSIDRFTKALGKTPNAALKSTKEMVKFARALGVGPNKLMGELNQNFEIFAEFGTKKGVDIFKKLQTAAKQTGIEFSKLTGIINKFDQSIEGTMEATGDLNFLLGGPFINSMELLEAEGPEKFEILRNAIEASGKSFDDMGRRQKKAIADVLGTDIEAASRFFSGQAGDIDAATAAIEGQVGEMKDLGKEAAENITLKEKDQLAQEAQVATMQNFADAILKANQTILELKKAFAPVVTILGAVASAAGIAFDAFILLKVAGVTTFDAFAKGFKKMIFSAGPVMLVLAAVAAAVYLVYDNWGTVVEGFKDGFKILKDVVSGTLDIIKGAIKIFIKGISYLIEGALQIMASPLTLIIEGIGLVANLIPGVSSDFARNYSPARAIRRFSSDIQSTIDSFETGTDSTKGGAFIAGDSSSGGAKPELVVAPPMSSVINNKNLQTLASLMNNTANSAIMAGAQEANIHITLKLDEKVLSRHTEKVSLNTMKEVFNQSR